MLAKITETIFIIMVEKLVLVIQKAYIAPTVIQNVLNFQNIT